MKRTHLFGTVHSASETLERAGIPRPRWTAEQLLSHRLGCAPIDLYLEESTPAVIARSDSDEAISFQADVAARAGGVPLQYLLGTAEFYGREFFVGPGVFIPRPETEVLIDTALECADRASRMEVSRAGSPGRGPVVVDVGTGSGAIGVTLRMERPDLKVFGVDSSESALSFASKNAAHHQADVTLLHGYLLDSFAPDSADLVVANLPYIDPATADAWPRELHWEPWLALNGGQQGLALIRELMGQARSVLRPGGWLVLEVGVEQVEEIRLLGLQQGLQFERLVQDLAGFERIVALSFGADS